MSTEKTRSDETRALERIVSAAHDVQAASTARQCAFRQVVDQPFVSNEACLKTVLIAALNSGWVPRHDFVCARCMSRPCEKHRVRFQGHAKQG